MAGAIKKTKTPRVVSTKKEMKPKNNNIVEKAEEVNEIPLVEKKEEKPLTSTEDLVQTLDSETYSSSDDGFDSSDNEEAAENSKDDEDDKKDASDFIKNASIVALNGGSKAAQAVEKAMAKSKALVSVSSNPGVVYLGRVPHGFYEEEMESYFAQFGQVCRLRLSRNKKTGKSKHYAFIEFASRDVAQIVAETMDNYLLLNHQLKCKLLEPTQIHEDLFKGANKKFKVVPWNKIERERHNAPKTETEHKKSVKALLGREQKKRKALEALGIDYSFPGVQAILKPVPEAKEEPVQKKAKGSAAKKTKRTKVKA